MKEFIDAMSSFVEMSKQIKENNPYSKKIGKTNWLKCIKLLKEGWKNEDCEELDNSDDIILVWKKENKIQHIKLTFPEQQLWLEYLEKNSGSNNE